MLCFHSFQVHFLLCSGDRLATAAVVSNLTERCGFDSHSTKKKKHLRVGSNRLTTKNEPPVAPMLFDAQVQGAKFSEEDIKALTHRIQFGGDEVVQAKDGAGSATLSMVSMIR